MTSRTPRIQKRDEYGEAVLVGQYLASKVDLLQAIAGIKGRPR